MPVQLVRPMTIIRFSKDGFFSAITAMIRISLGKQITISMNRLMIESTQPPK